MSGSASRDELSLPSLVFLFGSFTVYVAIQHSQQGAIVDHDTGAVDYAHLSVIYLSWFPAGHITASLVCATALGLLKGAGFLRRILLRRVPLRPVAACRDGHAKVERKEGYFGLPMFRRCGEQLAPVGPLTESSSSICDGPLCASLTVDSDPSFVRLPFAVGNVRRFV
jgi:hypothetical protein